MMRFIFILSVTALFFGALYTNQEQMVSLHFVWGMQTNALPLYLIVLGSFLLGLLLPALLFVPAWIRALLDRRRKSRRIEQLEIDLDKVRSEAMKKDVSVYPRKTPKNDL